MAPSLKEIASQKASKIMMLVVPMAPVTAQKRISEATAIAPRKGKAEVHRNKPQVIAPQKGKAEVHRRKSQVVSEVRVAGSEAPVVGNAVQVAEGGAPARKNEGARADAGEEVQAAVGKAQADAEVAVDGGEALAAGGGAPAADGEVQACGAEAPGVVIAADDEMLLCHWCGHWSVVMK